MEKQPYGWIRTVNRIIKAGRAKDFGDMEGCMCEDHIIKPDGKILQCGCENAPYIGTVFEDLSTNTFFGCYNEIKNYDENGMLISEVEKRKGLRPPD